MTDHGLDVIVAQLEIINLFCQQLFLSGYLEVPPKGERDILFFPHHSLLQFIAADSRPQANSSFEQVSISETQLFFHYPTHK